MNDVLRAATGERHHRLSDLFERVPVVDGGLNRMHVEGGSRAVRTVLGPPDDGRQEAYVLPAAEAADDRIGFDELPVALLRLDAQGRVRDANRLARDLLPATAEGDPEDRLAAMVEGLGRSVREWVGEAAAGRGLNRPEVVRVTGAEVETYLQITLGRPMEDDEGGLLAVLNDATELKTLEAQFVQSQKMQAIGQLAGGVAHDFNNLLTAISGHCDLLLLRHDEEDEDYADLTQITHNANRAAALVGQLLAFSRKQTLEMQPIDVRDALTDLAHLLNRLVGERVTLRLDHDPAVIPIRGDKRKLEQVLMNLVVNARDAMPDGGEILVATRCRWLDEPLTRDRVTVPPGQYVVIEVSDEGHGISPDNLSRIFEPFFTTKRPGEGTGLGLSMAYGIVKQSGGFIFADSDLGGGTRFSLYFPAMSPEADELADDADGGAVVEGVAFDPGEANASEPVVEHLDDEEPPEEQADVLEADDAPGGRVADPVPPHSDDNAQPGPAAAPIPANGDARRDGAFDGMEHVLAAVAASRREAADATEAEPGNVRESAGVDPGHGGEDAGVTPLPPLAPVDPPSAPAGDAADAVDAEVPTRPKAVILLVEDEAPVRAFASRALRLRGYEVLEAESAEAALDRLSDAGVMVDVFVTDVMMPGLDGPTWVRRALVERPRRADDLHLGLHAGRAVGDERADPERDLPSEALLAFRPHPDRREGAAVTWASRNHGPCVLGRETPDRMSNGT